MVKNPQPGGALALLRRESLASATQAEIEKLILTGEYPPGAKLGEEELAERLGVSRGPVREAFRGLEELGLIRFEKNRGVFVRKIGVDEADQSYIVRGALEELAGRIVAGKISADEAKLLQSIIKRMERAVERRNLAQYVDLNYEFHGTIVELTGNAKLIQEMPLSARRGENANAFLGGFRLWEEKGGIAVTDGACIPLVRKSS